MLSVNANTPAPLVPIAPADVPMINDPAAVADAVPCPTRMTAAAAREKAESLFELVGLVPDENPSHCPLPTIVPSERAYRTPEPATIIAIPGLIPASPHVVPSDGKTIDGAALEPFGTASSPALTLIA